MLCILSFLQKIYKNLQKFYPWKPYVFRNFEYCSKSFIVHFFNFYFKNCIFRKLFKNQSLQKLYIWQKLGNFYFALLLINMYFGYNVKAVDSNSNEI